MSEIKKIKGNITYKLRGDTANNWESLNPILAVREPGLVLDENGKTVAFKIGDGVTPWNDLESHNIDGNGTGSIDPAILQKKLELWQPNTEYKVGDVVVAQTVLGNGLANVILTCIENHTSSNSSDYMEFISKWTLTPINSYQAINDASGNDIVETYATRTYVANTINSAIDKTYSASVNKKSHKAQSGIAVDAAITDGLKTIKTDIDSLKSQMSGKLSRRIVEILPDADQSISNTIYMLKNNSNNTDNIYDEYLPITTKNEPIEFNQINIAKILELSTGYDISENVDLMIEDTTFYIYYGDKTEIWIDCLEVDYLIILDTTILDQSTIDILNDIMNWSGDYNKYPSISFSNYSNSQLGNLTFNTNKRVYELIGSTAVDLSNYYTKDEIDATIGSIETALDNIISLQNSLIGGGSV